MVIEAILRRVVTSEIVLDPIFEVMLAPDDNRCDAENYRKFKVIALAVLRGLQQLLIAIDPVGVLHSEIGVPRGHFPPATFQGGLSQNKDCRNSRFGLTPAGMGQ